MKITTDTSDLLILRFTRWKSPLIYALVTVLGVWVSVKVFQLPGGNIGWFLTVFLLSSAWTLPMALLRAERSMLVLNAMSGEAELHHRTVSGLHRHHWPLEEVQSTRITRFRPEGAADDDPKRMITLFVREGMDEGRHKLTNHSISAKDALDASARVSTWMKDWRARVDSGANHA